jgi:hypothetical protein
MANAVYPKFLEKLWKGDIDTDVDTFRVALVTSAYVYSSAHEFYSSVSGVLAVGTLAGITITSGIFDADDLLINAITGNINALVIHKWTGAAGTSPLFLFLDTGIGLDRDPAGNDVRIIWPSDANAKIYPLGGRV